jgi:hypothetical protein
MERAEYLAQQPAVVVIRLSADYTAPIAIITDNNNDEYYL